MIEPTKVEATVRNFEGRWIDEGYVFIGVGASADWRAVAAWGRDGWDLGEWPYIICLFRGDLERAIYCEGDIRVETYASREERERATDETALFYWRSRGEEWVDGIDFDHPPAYLLGPYSRSRAAE